MLGRGGEPAAETNRGRPEDETGYELRLSHAADVDQTSPARSIRIRSERRRTINEL